MHKRKDSVSITIFGSSHDILKNTKAIVMNPRISVSSALTYKFYEYKMLKARIFLQALLPNTKIKHMYAKRHLYVGFPSFLILKAFRNEILNILSNAFTLL